MSRLSILTYGNPLLRKKSREIGEITEEVRNLAREMTEIIKEEKGLGLAAPQVGKSLRMILINTKADEEGTEPIICLNPRIVETGEETIEYKEGCLSIPDVTGMVRRKKRIKVKAFDLNNKEHLFNVEDLTSVIFQHEIDHLDGVLFVDKISMQDKTIADPQLKALAKENKKSKKKSKHA